MHYGEEEDDDEQVAPHRARFLEMPDAAFNGVLPARFHGAWSIALGSPGPAEVGYIVRILCEASA